MSTHPKINFKKLLLVTAVMLLAVGLTGTALNAATFDATTTSTLRLRGITEACTIDPCLNSLSNITFEGDLEIYENTATNFASTEGTYIAHTINNNEIRRDATGSLGFIDEEGFGIGDSFTLNSRAFSEPGATNSEFAFAGASGSLALTSTSNFEYQVFFNLTWSMSATTTTTGAGVNSTAETFIFADIQNGPILANNILGRSVNGLGDFTNASVSTDFSVLLAPGATRNVSINSNEARGFIDTAETTDPPANPVPIPATLWLFGSALVGMVGLRQRITKKNG